MWQMACRWTAIFDMPGRGRPFCRAFRSSLSCGPIHRPSLCRWDAATEMRGRLPSPPAVRTLKGHP